MSERFLHLSNHHYIYILIPVVFRKTTQTVISSTKPSAEDCLTEPLPLGSCLFCDRYISLNYLPNESLDSAKQSDLAKRVLNHMFDVHKFSVPFPERLADPAGLLIELGRIVGEERCCLACGRQFYGSCVEGSDNARISLSAVRSHMLDKPGHKQVWYGVEDPVQVALLVAKAEEESNDDCKINYPKAALAGGELFSQFYDQSVLAPSFILVSCFLSLIGELKRSLITQVIQELIHVN